MMTLEQIEALPQETLTCKIVAPLLGFDTYALHIVAQREPERLGFPVIVIRSRVKIPKRPFIKFMRGELVQ